MTNYRFAFSLLSFASDDGTLGGSIFSETAAFPGSNCSAGQIIVPLNNGTLTLPVVGCLGVGESPAPSISIYPKSYWSYGGIYDTETGEAV